MNKIIDIENTKRHKNFNQALLNTVLAQDKRLVESTATVESRKIYKMSREVGTEIHRLKSFVRLEFSKPNILHARIKAEHKIEDILIDFFIERFPTMIIIIESNKGCFSKSIDTLFTKHLTSLQQTILMIQDNNQFSNQHGSYDYLDDFREEYWSEFYNSQSIGTRKNKKLFSSRIPKKFRYLDGLNEERKAFSDSRGLSEFI